MARIFSRVLVVLLTVLVIVGGVTSLPSCAPSLAPQFTSLGKMHIIDATHLFIAPGSGNKLFKITEAGYIREVTYEDENGINIPMVTEPVAIYDVNSEYVIVCFGETEANISGGYLVRKTDGAVFSLENAGFPLPNGSIFMNGDSEAVFTDSSGNIYYCVGTDVGCEIIKLNTENMNSITKIVYSPSGDNVWLFTVDKDGNAAYWGCVKGDRSRHFKRIRTAEGSIYDGLFYNEFFWLGPDGVIYCASFKFMEEPSIHYYCIIEKISINATTGVPTKSEYSSCNFTSEYRIASCYKLELQDRVILTLDWEIIEVYNPTNSARCLNTTDSFGLSSVRSAVASDNFYYLYGWNDVLVKVDPTDDSYTVLSLSTEEYYLYTMSTTTADELIFNALRMSDGVNIVGKFDVSGNLTILDEESDVEMIVLERIQ